MNTAQGASRRASGRSRHGTPSLLEALESRTLLSAAPQGVHHLLVGHGLLKMPVFVRVPPLFSGTGIGTTSDSGPGHTQITGANILAAPAPGAMTQLPPGGFTMRWGPVDPPVLVPDSVQAVAGIAGTFRVAEGNFTFSMYDIVIDWGDGTAPSVAGIEYGGVTRSVPPHVMPNHLTGQHVYARAGDYEITIKVTLNQGIKDEGAFMIGDPMILHTTARVTQNSIAGGSILAGTTITGAAGETVPFPALFNEVGQLPASRFYGRIDWGDGTTSDGEVTKTGDTTYTVAGGHAYARAGQYRITTAFGFVPLHPGTDYHYTSYSTAVIDLVA